MPKVNGKKRNRRISPNWVIAGGLGVVMSVLGVVVPSQTNAAQSATLVPTGRLFASNCFQCHGTNGASGAFDALYGESAADTYHKVKELQSSGGIMGAQARGYSDAELKAIAAYFASLPKK